MKTIEEALDVFGVGEEGGDPFFMPKPLSYSGYINIYNIYKSQQAYSDYKTYVAQIMNEGESDE